jgi:hypothetical protein
LDDSSHIIANRPPPTEEETTASLFDELPHHPKAQLQEEDENEPAASQGLTLTKITEIEKRPPSFHTRFIKSTQKGA